MKIRTAVIGCGRIYKVYEHAFDKLKDMAEPVLFIDKVPERAALAAEHFPGSAYSDKTADEDVKELLMQYRPDILHILLPHHLHVRYAELAMECGINVITEKPISIDMDSVRELIEKRNECGRDIGVILQNRYIPGVKRVRELIASGSLGRVKGAFSNLNWYRPESYYSCDWKGRWATEGGGVVIDQAIHSIDLVRYMTGLEAVRIKGHISRRVLTSIEVEDEADAAIFLENGAVYSFYACNYFTSNSPIRIGITCEKADIMLTYETVDITFPDGRHEHIEADEGQNGTDKGYWGTSHYLQIKDCYQAFMEKRPMPWQLEDAARCLEIVLGIYLSSRTNSDIELRS